MERGLRSGKGGVVAVCVAVLVVVGVVLVYLAVTNPRLFKKIK